MYCPSPCSRFLPSLDFSVFITMAILKRSSGTSRPSSSSSALSSSVSCPPLPGLGLDPEELFRDLDDIAIGDIPFLIGLLRRTLYCTGSCLESRTLRRKYSHVFSSSPSPSSLLNLKTSSVSSPHPQGQSHPSFTTSFPTGDPGDKSELPTSSSASRSLPRPPGVGLATSSKRQDKKASRWRGGKKEEQETMLQQGDRRERRGRDWQSFLREASAPCSCVSCYQETFASLEEDGGGACGAQLRKGDIGFRCIDCEHDSTCVVCGRLCMIKDRGRDSLLASVFRFHPLAVGKVNFPSKILCTVEVWRASKLSCNEPCALERGVGCVSSFLDLSIYLVCLFRLHPSRGAWSISIDYA